MLLHLYYITFGWLQEIFCLDELKFCSSDQTSSLEWTKTFVWTVLL